MAIERDGLFSQSSSRIDKGALRSLRQSFARKGGAALGPEGVQAFVEGELEAEKRLKAEQSRQLLSFRQGEEQLEEQKRQFNIQSRQTDRSLRQQASDNRRQGFVKAATGLALAAAFFFG